MAAKCKHLSFASVILAVRPYCLACVEIEGYSVTYFGRIAAFEALYR